MSPSISLAPHLQRALDTMSRDLSVEPQALLNQAVSAWLRINGYTLPVAAAPVVAEPSVVVEPSVMAEQVSSTPPPVPGLDLGPSLVRMAEIDADLERLARPWAAWAKVQPDEAPVEEEVPAPVPTPPIEPDEPGIEANTGENEMEQPGDSTIVLRSAPIALYLEREGEEPIRITADRFVIGRGPHCDLVIDSPRVSREHVALTRKGILFFIEDLNSSNGTWFGEERVTTRELESGDVINVGNVPMTFFLRGE